MSVYGVGKSYFVVWIPKFLFQAIVHCHPDFDKTLSNLVAFHEKHVANELVTRKLEMLMFKKEQAINMPLFCICQKPEQV